MEKAIKLETSTTDPDIFQIMTTNNFTPTQYIDPVSFDKGVEYEMHQNNLQLQTHQNIWYQQNNGNSSQFDESNNYYIHPDGSYITQLQEISPYYGYQTLYDETYFNCNFDGVQLDQSQRYTATDDYPYQYYVTEYYDCSGEAYYDYPNYDQAYVQTPPEYIGEIIYDHDQVYVQTQPEYFGDMYD